MCDCMKRLHEQLKPEIDTYYGKDGNEVISFNIRKSASGRAIVNIYIDTKKSIKPKETFILADFCPWCGVKYK